MKSLNGRFAGAHELLLPRARPIPPRLYPCNGISGARGDDAENFISTLEPLQHRLR